MSQRFDFAKEAKRLSARDILNYYRNLYYKEPIWTERGIVADAINKLLPKLSRTTTTVDAVEVVRCKDCKHRKNPEECPMCFTEVVDVVGGRMYKFTDLTSDNGYCHMGAKMDGGAK